VAFRPSSLKVSQSHRFVVEKFRLNAPEKTIAVEMDMETNIP